MKTKYILLIGWFVLTLIIQNKLTAQNTPNDVVFVKRINQLLQAPVRLAVDNQNNVYSTDVSLKCI